MEENKKPYKTFIYIRNQEPTETQREEIFELLLKLIEIVRKYPVLNLVGVFIDSGVFTHQRDRLFEFSEKKAVDAIVCNAFEEICNSVNSYIKMSTLMTKGIYLYVLDCNGYLVNMNEVK